MQYNPPPKSEFVKDPESIKAHHLLVENTALRAAFAITISELSRRSAQHTPPDNFNLCASSHLRLLGAHDFIDTFLNLAEAEVVAPRKDNANLPSNIATLPNRKN